MASTSLMLSFILWESVVELGRSFPSGTPTEKVKGAEVGRSRGPGKDRLLRDQPVRELGLECVQAGLGGVCCGAVLLYPHFTLFWVLEKKELPKHRDVAFAVDGASMAVMVLEKIRPDESSFSTHRHPESHVGRMKRAFLNFGGLCRGPCSVVLDVKISIQVRVGFVSEPDVVMPSDGPSEYATAEHLALRIVGLT